MMKRLSSFRNQGRKEVMQIAAPIVQSQQERSLALRSWNVATTLGGSKKADANSVVEKTKKQRRANYETQEEAQTNCQKEALYHR
jgi:hypothetical protein